MNKLTLKSIIFSFAAVILFSITAKAQTNFNGTWSRNLTKCRLPQGTGIDFVPAKIVIDQTGSNISITRYKEIDGQTTNYTETLNFDGSATVSSPEANIKKSTVLAWSDDKKSFNTTATYTDQDGTEGQVSKVKWETSDGGKTLIVTIDMKIIDQDPAHITEVFERAK